MDSFRRGRGLYDDIPWGRGSMGPWDGKGPPPRHTREDSRKPEVRKIRNNEKNGIGSGCTFGSVNALAKSKRLNQI